MMDTLLDSLEDFYGNPNWEAQFRITGSRSDICGVPRVPGGRVVCAMLVGHEPAHIHRGYDQAQRSHSWESI